MSYPFNYPTPTNANVQIFYAITSTPGNFIPLQTWTKPQGASFVWFTLIGAGGGGGNSDGANNFGGGGSGAVTNCMVPAFLIPDSLQVQIGVGGYGTSGVGSAGGSGGSTLVKYTTASSTYTLLTANGGSGGTFGSGGAGGTSSTSNYFSCIGFYQSVAGQAGNVNVAISTGNTFLTGGTSYVGNFIGPYNYIFNSSNAGGANGFFRIQPIILGTGGGGNPNNAGNGGIGCGGAGVNAGNNGPSGSGGNGLCVIITW